MRLIFLGLLISNLLSADEAFLINQLKRYVRLDPKVEKGLYHISSNQKKKNQMEILNNHKLPIYSAFSNLQQTLPRLELGNLPTPIERLPALEDTFNNKVQLYVKRDDLTGKTVNGNQRFGGNKVRKLEFLLADAMQKGCRTVMTYGAAGSNHATATASCAQLCDLHCINLLTPQIPSWVVQRNLLLMKEYGAEIILNPNPALRSMQTVCSFVQSQFERDEMPYLIPTGGSCPLGVIGFINAAFELKEQIKNGLLPEPDYIYHAAGSGGTTAGLMLGLIAAGLTTEVRSVAVEPEDRYDPLKKQIKELLNETGRLLHTLDETFPMLTFLDGDVNLNYKFTGKKYGACTKEGDAATALMKTCGNIQLDVTYTAKACAAMLHDLNSGVLDGKVVLFWNTFCGSVEPKSKDFSTMPRAFRGYFED